MKFSPIVQQIIIDLIKAKNPVPKQFRYYHKGGKYRGERGAPFDDIRERKDKIDTSKSKPDIDKVDVINDEGRIYRATRTAITHTGEHKINVDVFHQTIIEDLIDEIETTMKVTGDNLESSGLPQDQIVKLWERAIFGKQMATTALGMFENGEDRDERLFVARENGMLKSLCYASLDGNEVYIHRLGTVGLSGDGAGSTLLKEVMGWAKKSGVRFIRLEPSPDARNFYNKHGFDGDVYFTCDLNRDLDESNIKLPDVPNIRNPKELIDDGEKVWAVIENDIPDYKMGESGGFEVAISALYDPDSWRKYEPIFERPKSYDELQRAEQAMAAGAKKEDMYKIVGHKSYYQAKKNQAAAPDNPMAKLDEVIMDGGNIAKAIQETYFPDHPEIESILSGIHSNDDLDTALVKIFDILYKF